MSTRPRNQPIAAAEHATLRTYLAKLGLQPAHLDAAVGKAPGNRTRQQVADALRSWLRGRPKG